MPAPTNGSLGESTPLLGPRRDNEPKWKSYSRTVGRMVWGTLCSNYVNVLLVFVPLGIIAGKMHWSPTAVFVLNFIAIMPLAALLSFATEELSAKLGQTLGGLCNATFGNAVELIVSTGAQPLPAKHEMGHHHRLPNMCCTGCSPQWPTMRPPHHAGSAQPSTQSSCVLGILVQAS